jgi:DNA-directed RNA polymerase subunit RPC12/RpoP
LTDVKLIVSKWGYFGESELAFDCRGLCLSTYKFDRQGGNSQLYLQGAKRCQQCDGRYIKWDGIFCPCCGTRLRLKPRKSKLKEKVLVEKQIMRL